MGAMGGRKPKRTAAAQGRGHPGVERSAGKKLPSVCNFEQKAELAAGRIFKLGASPMAEDSTPQVLVVDDDPTVCSTVAFLLKSAGYGVSTAENGFDALLQVRKSEPALIVSDLNMPEMSGFELLSVVRRRFPELLVVAMSGAYDRGESVPGGVIADAFYAKGRSDPQALLGIVADVLQTSASRRTAHRQQSAPVWIPRNGRDSAGIPYIVLTCTECLRSFPLHVTEDVNPEVVETACIFCFSKVRYIIDFSLSVASPAENREEDWQRRKPAKDLLTLVGGGCGHK